MVLPNREAVIALLHGALRPTPFVHAAWLEGADAAGRADEYSDIDLWLDVDHPSLERAFELVRTTLETLGPLDVEDVHVHPDPAVQQRFYRTVGLPPHWFVDVCVQVHGRDVAFGPHDPFAVLFDRSGVIRVHHGEIAPQDVHRAVQALRARQWRWLLVEKEVKRGYRLEALAYYHAEVLGALVEVLRLRHCPWKRDYGLKHVYDDLPGEVVERLEVLHSFTTLDELMTGVQRAAQWFDALMQEHEES